MRRLGLFGVHKLGPFLEGPTRYLPLMGQTGLRERAVVHVYMMRPDGPDVSVSIPTAMNTKCRVRHALESRLMAARTRIMTEQNLMGWRLKQRTPVRIGTNLPIVLPFGKRLDRLPHTLEPTADREIAIQVHISNNSCERSPVDTAAASSLLPVTVHQSPRNIEGFGRFYLVRGVAKAKHHAVVFTDYEQDFGPTAITELVSCHQTFLRYPIRDSSDPGRRAIRLDSASR